ncbi:metallophosphoesterase [Natranaeroarchaeum sulfidigenes]|uniref:metallophosphoesterase n=1 Tax=Natranaeroarchaeum sulfidigenes TaxID=2784880 RepID=UPI001EE53BB9|nr:metallophosphoesterase [Natranaeroarchaeum sulfidigenes]
MSRYVISDHHFGHTNIIEYCDRPFSSVGAMNNTLLDRHYETVDDEAVLIHLGDVAMDMQDGRETIEYFQRLDGDLLVRGNHDVGLEPEQAPFPVLDSCVLNHDDYTFYCAHRPEDIPDDWDGWIIHGHMHNNDTDGYPFVAVDDQRVNVSSELLNFRPLALDTITSIINKCPEGSRLRDINVAKERLEINL